MKFSMLKLAAAAVVAFGSLSANAAVINHVTNGSFEESPGQNSVTFGNGAAFDDIAKSFESLATRGAGYSWAVFENLPGWKAFTGHKDANGDFYGVEAHYSGTIAGTNAVEGNYYVELDTHFNYQNAKDSNGGIYQIVKNLVVGQDYQLTFSYRGRTEDMNDNGVNVYFAHPDALWSLAGQPKVVSMETLGSQGWKQYTYNVKAVATEMVLAFESFGNVKWNNTSVNGNAKGAAIDAVSLVQVSAPATAALFAFAAAGLMFRRRQA